MKRVVIERVGGRERCQGGSLDMCTSPQAPSRVREPRDGGANKPRRGFRWALYWVVQNRGVEAGRCSEPLPMCPTGGGFPVPTWLAAVVRSRQAGARSHFRAPMPSLCHSPPSKLALRVASEFGHVLAFSGAFQEYLIRRVHRLPRADQVIIVNPRGRSEVSCRPTKTRAQTGRGRHCRYLQRDREAPVLAPVPQQPSVPNGHEPLENARGTEVTHPQLKWA